VDDNVDAMWLVYLILGALVCGGVVLFLKPDYRFESIIESNKNYYPAINVAPPGESKSTNSGGRERSRPRG